MASQGELLPVEHRSLQPKRLGNFGHVNAEAIYAAEWRRINKQIPDLLWLLLAPDDRPRWLSVSRRDAAVAASIIQWLATNVGHGFVRYCDRKWEEACARRLEIGAQRARRHQVDERTPLQRRKARLDAARKRLAASTNR